MIPSRRVASPAAYLRFNQIVKERFAANNLFRLNSEVDQVVPAAVAAAPSTADYVATALTKARKPLNLAAIHEALVAAGLTTNASNSRQSLSAAVQT